MTREAVFEPVKEVGIIPAIRPSDPDEAMHAARAIRLGGIPVLEISLSMPDAVQAIAVTAACFGSEILLGAGSLLDAEGYARRTRRVRNSSSHPASALTRFRQLES